MSQNHAHAIDPVDRPAIADPEGRDVRPLVRQLREEMELNRGDLTRPGFQAMAVYRFGVWLLGRRGVVRLAGDVVYRIMHFVVRNVYGIELPRAARIGRGVRFAHQGGIVVHGDARIGEDCFIRQNVTIGAAGAQKNGAPSIGPRTEIGVGAVIVGGIEVGADVRVGPNAVVMADVPAGASVFAPPARVLQLGTVNAPDRGVGDAT